MEIKKIALFSPIPLNAKLQTGISIRINELNKWLKTKGAKVSIYDKFNQSIFNNIDSAYIMISTKPFSISSQVASEIPKDKLLIIDLYTPVFLEKDIYYSKFNPKILLDKIKAKNSVKNILRRGDHFLVANKRQKKYWIKTAQSLDIKIMPFDISSIPTGAPKPIKFERTPQQIILWFGGIYPWFDPMPLARAFSALSKKHPNWKLRIIGAYHPGTGYQKIYKDFIKNLKNIPKNQIELLPWQNPKNLALSLKDVAFAVHLPKKTLEDYYSHRARLLTLTNHKVPVLTNGNDLISHIIISQGGGSKIVPEIAFLRKTMNKLMLNSKKLNLLIKNTENVQTYFIHQEISETNLKNFFNTKKNGV